MKQSGKPKRKKAEPEKLSGVMGFNCPTCPYRSDGNGYTEVADLLSNRALKTATPICHSTGSSNITEPEKKLTHLHLACRGARDLQLKYFKLIGFIEAATDEAWNKKCKEMGLPVLPTVRKFKK